MCFLVLKQTRTFDWEVIQNHLKLIKLQVQIDISLLIGVIEHCSINIFKKTRILQSQGANSLINLKLSTTLWSLSNAKELFFTKKRKSFAKKCILNKSHKLSDKLRRVNLTIKSLKIKL